MFGFRHPLVFEGLAAAWDHVDVVLSSFRLGLLVQHPSKDLKSPLSSSNGRSSMKKT